MNMIFNNSVSSLIVWYDEGPLRTSRRFGLYVTDTSIEVDFYVNSELAKQYSHIVHH